MEAEKAVLQVNGETLHLPDMVRALKAGDGPGILQGFSRRLLIRQLARREGISVSSEELQQCVDEWRYARRLERVEDTDAWLAQREVSFQDVVAEVEIRRLEHRLSVQTTLDQIEPYFVRRRLDFDEADVCWIFSRSEGVAEELALQAREGGADIYALARAHSEDEATRPGGGYLGRLRRNGLPGGISERLFARSPGRVLGPEKVPGGFGLYWLQAFYPARSSPGVRKEIRKTLFEAWLQRELRTADIRFFGGASTPSEDGVLQSNPTGSR